MAASTVTIGDSNKGEASPALLPLSMNQKQMGDLGLKTGPSRDDTISHHLFRKDFILDECSRMGFYSAFHPHRERIKKYEGVELLVVADHEEQHGENWYLVMTEQAKQEELKRLQLAEQDPNARDTGLGDTVEGNADALASPAADDTDGMASAAAAAAAAAALKIPRVHEAPLPVGQYLSATAHASAAEVQGPQLRRSRPLIRIRVVQQSTPQQGGSESAAAATTAAAVVGGGKDGQPPPGLHPLILTDRNREGPVVEMRARRDPAYELQRCELTVGVQTTPSYLSGFLEVGVQAGRWGQGSSVCVQADVDADLQELAAAHSAEDTRLVPALAAPQQQPSLDSAASACAAALAGQNLPPPLRKEVLLLEQMAHAAAAAGGGATAPDPDVLSALISRAAAIALAVEGGGRLHPAAAGATLGEGHRGGAGSTFISGGAPLSCSSNGFGDKGGGGVPPTILTTTTATRSGRTSGQGVVSPRASITAAAPGSHGQSHGAAGGGFSGGHGRGGAAAVAAAAAAAAEASPLASLLRFLSRALPLTEVALSQNETLDIYCPTEAFLGPLAGEDEDDMGVGGGEGGDAATGPAAPNPGSSSSAVGASHLREERQFMDLELTNNKALSVVDWHPRAPTWLAASASARLTLEQRTAESDLPQAGHVLILTTTEFTAPLVLSAPAGVSAVAWNPSASWTIAVGLVTGQVAVYDLQEAMATRGSGGGGGAGTSAGGGKGTAVAPGGELVPAGGARASGPGEVPPAPGAGGSGQQRIWVEPLHLSCADNSHGREVIGLKWLPTTHHLNHRLVFSEEAPRYEGGAQAASHQFLSVGSDGSTCVWDVRYKEKAGARGLRRRASIGGGGGGIAKKSAAAAALAAAARTGGAADGGSAVPTSSPQPETPWAPLYRTFIKPGSSSVGAPTTGAAAAPGGGGPEGLSLGGGAPGASGGARASSSSSAAGVAAGPVSGSGTSTSSTSTGGGGASVTCFSLSPWCPAEPLLCGTDDGRVLAVSWAPPGEAVGTELWAKSSAGPKPPGGTLAAAAAAKEAGGEGLSGQGLSLLPARVVWGNDTALSSRPTVTVLRSLFLEDLFVTVSDFHVSVWARGAGGAPLLTLPPTPPDVTYTVGRWSPTRPALLFLGRSDGSVEAWDLLDSTTQPVLSLPLVSSAIVSLQFRTAPAGTPHGGGEAGAPGAATIDVGVGTAGSNGAGGKQLLAAGDAKGTLHLLEVAPSLSRCSVGGVASEEARVSAYVQREVSRAAYVAHRGVVHEAERVEQEAAAARALAAREAAAAAAAAESAAGGQQSTPGGPVQQSSGRAAGTATAALAEAEYRAMEAQVLGLFAMTAKDVASATSAGGAEAARNNRRGSLM